MEKDFNAWNEVKKEVHGAKQRSFFREREVWFSSIGINVGFEQDGGKGFLRPVIIVKKFSGFTCWCVPMTKTVRSGYHYSNVILSGRNRTAILSQLRLIDSRRLHHKIGLITEGEFKNIKTKLMQFLA